MVNEKGAICTAAKLDREFYKEFYGKNLIYSYFFLAGSAVIIVIYIFLLACLNPFPSEWHGLAIFIMPFAFSLWFIIAVNTAVPKRAEAKNNEQECEIYSDYLICNLYEQGLKSAVAKVYFKYITKRRETKSYIILFVNNVNFYAVSKKDLTKDQVHMLKHIFAL